MRHWVLLHVLSMFVAYGLALGPSIMLYAVGRSRDVRAIRTVFGLMSRIGPATGIAFLLGIAGGIGSIVAGGFNPWAPWLVVTYVLLVLMMGLSDFGARWMRNVGKASAASPDDQPSAELSTLLAAPIAVIQPIGSAVALVIFVYLMVTKPGLS